MQPVAQLHRPQEVPGLGAVDALPVGRLSFRLGEIVDREDVVFALDKPVVHGADGYACVGCFKIDTTGRAAMLTNRSWMIIFGAWMLQVWWVSTACGQVSIREQFTTGGTVEAMATGRLTVRDDQGRRRRVG